ncbi:MAG: helix-turn-helix transcriptional regulator [Candidatus Vogelbacteria bacterium]|nr:helix-turn-helix transcriptional regulator [Candidatus Vogelbacteria bacterium]
MSNTAQKLGLNIRRLREEKGLLQSDLCKKLRVEAPYLSNIENGNKNPTLLTIEKIAKALGVTVSELTK